MCCPTASSLGGVQARTHRPADSALRPTRFAPSRKTSFTCYLCCWCISLPLLLQIYALHWLNSPLSFSLSSLSSSSYFLRGSLAGCSSFVRYGPLVVIFIPAWTTFPAAAALSRTFLPLLFGTTHLAFLTTRTPTPLGLSRPSFAYIPE